MLCSGSTVHSQVSLMAMLLRRSLQQLGSRPQLPSHFIGPLTSLGLTLTQRCHPLCSSLSSCAHTWWHPGRLSRQAHPGSGYLPLVCCTSSFLGHRSDSPPGVRSHCTDVCRCGQAEPYSGHGLCDLVYSRRCAGSLPLPLSGSSVRYSNDRCTHDGLRCFS